MISDNYKELTREEYLALLEKTLKRTKERKCPCMYPGCSNDAIFSHVFQRRNQQLSEITTNGKVYAFTYNHLFAFLRNEPLLEYKELGISNQFGFPGFCDTHDSELFAPIERTDCAIDWYEERNQYLLAYRTLCREIHANKVMREFSSEILDRIISCNEDLFFQFVDLKANSSQSLQDLDRYKAMFEKGIFGSDYSKYYFKVVQLPYRLELCLAAPIIIRNEYRGSYWGPDENKITNPINIIEIFPSKNSTYILIGFAESFPNTWAFQIYGHLQSDEIEDVSWALQDILFRAEFHCISRDLHEELAEDIPLFLHEWYELKNNFDSDMIYKSDIFKKPILRRLGYKL